MKTTVNKSGSAGSATLNSVYRMQPASGARPNLSGGEALMTLLKWIIGIVGSAAAIGLPIYFSDHPYKPGDFLPRLAGIVGAIMMFSGALFYVIRKRVKRLRNLGKIKYWLEAHILFCLFGPLLIVYHSAFTISAPNSAIAYYSMMIVVASGVVGRYIYRHFQVSLSGERASLKEMTEEISQLHDKVKSELADSQTILDLINHFFGMKGNSSSPGLVKSTYLMLKFDFLEGRLKRQIKKYLKERKYHVLEGSIEEMLIRLVSLEKKVKGLEVTARLFSYWHKLHVPFIWILLVTFIFHIVAVMVF